MPAASDAATLDSSRFSRTMATSSTRNPPLPNPPEQPLIELEPGRTDLGDDRIEGLPTERLGAALRIAVAEPEENPHREVEEAALRPAPGIRREPIRSVCGSQAVKEQGHLIDPGRAVSLTSPTNTGSAAFIAAITPPLFPRRSGAVRQRMRSDG